MRLLSPRAPRRLLTLGLAVVLLAACDDGDSTSSSTSSGTGGVGGGATATGSTAASFSNGSTTASGTGGGVPCAGVMCDPDEHCDAATETCVLNTCADLQCSATEECVLTMNGGAICEDIACTQDVECPEARYCNGTICVDDACVPGAATCAGDDLFECPPNGSPAVAKLTCGSTAYFVSQCVDPGQGDAYCGCEDDWDCPSYTTCEVGQCVGTGVAPTCTLPPEPFANVLPVNEIQWGGVSQASKNAVGAPFPTSSQVSVVPIIINLDDDNGDGQINELDFAEIVFTTYCNTDISVNGAVRAIHGGGPNKGKDYFATLGPLTWHEGDDINMVGACASGTANSTANVAAADIDNDGIPEIVVANETTGLTILDNEGNLVASSAANQWAGYPDPAVTIANVDNAGFAEIVVGRVVFTVAHDAMGKLVFQDRFSGALMSGSNGQGPIPCIANIAGDARQEIIAGTTVYGWPAPPPGVTKIAECAMGATDDFCLGKLSVVWDGQTVNGAVMIPNAQRDGFCAIADILGVDETMDPGPTNPLDGKAEVVVIAEGYLIVLNGETGTRRRFINLGVGTDGGAPNVDDFDGDGFPEIGTAFGTRYFMIDLQSAVPGTCPAWPNALSDALTGLQGNPARMPGPATCAMDSDCAVGAVCGAAKACVCLHNAWQRITEDDSSRVTSSSVFDFNGDGAAEVIYNDECYFRVYDGIGGTPLFKHHSPSRTRVENPAIADADNDGNAEIIFASNNDTNSCSEGNNYPNGIAVWGDDSDTWVSARRIWNQHAYHVTNVLESGGVPLHEPESWKTYNGRKYNTYRSNPRSSGVAPDLTIGGIQVSSPNATCGQLSTLVDITVQIDNIGDQRVGPGVDVTFYGDWMNPMLSEALHADAMGTPLVAPILSSIEPGGSILVTVQYNAAFNAPGTLPAVIRAVVDEADKERECDEANNTIAETVDPGTQKADLAITLGAVNAGPCPAPTVAVTLTNLGSSPASNVVVRYYAGDPNQGGTAFQEEVVPGPLAAGGGTTTFLASLVNFPANLSILVYGVADPDDAIPECNDANNKDAADAKLYCSDLN